MPGTPKDTILILDDDADVLLLLKKLLKGEGYRCLTSTEPRTALDLIQNESVLVVISDINMPSMRGTEFVRLAHIAHVDAEMILMTGLPDVESAIEAVRSGVCDYLVKPLVPDTVRQVIRKAMVVAKLRRENHAHRLHLEDLVQARTQELDKVTLLLIRSGDAQIEDLSREIHDGLGQSLVALKMAVQRMMGRMEPTPAKTDMQGIVGAVSNAIEECRHLSHRISPIAIARLGLRKAIEDLAASFSQKGGMRLETDIREMDQYFEGDWNLHVYRIIQEALTNAYKYSGGSKITIGCKVEGGMMRIWVKDDGKGRPEKESDGIGLITMRRRTALLGGTLTTTSGDEGFEVSVTTPSNAGALYQNGG